MERNEEAAATASAANIVIRVDNVDENSKTNNEMISIDDDEKKKKKMILERRHSIRELIETERDLYRELAECYALFVNDTAVRRDLFEELKPVIDFSSALLNQFEAELDGIDVKLISEHANEIDSYQIGKCLNQHSDEMRKVYARYVRDHAWIASEIKRYEQDPALVIHINSRFQSSKHSFKVPSLSVILIKPVQRIFKYPLFISRLVEVRNLISNIDS